MDEIGSPHPLGFAAGDANLYRVVFNAPTVYTDPSGQILPILIGGVALALGGIGGLHYAASRYDYAREHYLFRPIHQWTPEVQAEYRDYVRTTDWIAAGSEVTAVTGISMVATPYIAYGSGYLWTAGGTGGRILVSTAGVGGFGYAGYDGYTIVRDWHTMEGSERFRRVGDLAGPTLVGLGTGPRFFRLGAAVGRVPGSSVARVDPYARWAILRDSEGQQRIVFDPRYATPLAPGPLGPPRGTPRTLAVIGPDGRVLVLEGMHRLELAQLGAFPAGASGRIPGWPWWLLYDYMPRPR